MGVIGKTKLVGRTYLISYSGCDEKIISNTDKLLPLYNELLQKSKVTVIKSIYHQFEPYGVSIASIIAESSISLHSYVEEKIVTIDFYTCNLTIPIKSSLLALGVELGANKHELQIVDRWGYIL